MPIPNGLFLAIIEATFQITSLESVEPVGLMIFAIWLELKKIDEKNNKERKKVEVTILIRDFQLKKKTLVANETPMIAPNDLVSKKAVKSEIIGITKKVKDCFLKNEQPINKAGAINIASWLGDWNGKANR